MMVTRQKLNIHRKKNTFTYPVLCKHETKSITGVLNYAIPAMEARKSHFKTCLHPYSTRIRFVCYNIIQPKCYIGKTNTAIFWTSGLWHHTVSTLQSNILTSNFDTEDVGMMFFCNAGTHLPEHTMS